MLHLPPTIRRGREALHLTLRLTRRAPVRRFESRQLRSLLCQRPLEELRKSRGGFGAFSFAILFAEIDWLNRDRENSTVVVVTPAEAQVVEEDLKKLFRDVSFLILRIPSK